MVWPCWSWYNLIQGSVSLWGWVLRFFSPRRPLMSQFNFLLSARCMSLSYYSTIYDYRIPYFFVMMIMDLTSQTLSKTPQLYIFFLRVTMDMVSVHSNKNPNEDNFCDQFRLRHADFICYVTMLLHRPLPCILSTLRGLKQIHRR